MHNNQNGENNPFFNPNIVQYNAILNQEIQKANKIKDFKERIAAFENITTIEEAKALATKILPTANEINRFYISDAKCVVINRDDLLRISIDTNEEFICYNFS